VTALRKSIDITDFSRVVPLLTLRYICTFKNDTATTDTHRQNESVMYTSSSGRIQGSPLPRRFRMTIQAHLVELERKHKTLENELHEALVHLSTDDLQIVELKRRKLMVKDQIERLRHGDTLH
jgi:hypothetical protein